VANMAASHAVAGFGSFRVIEGFHKVGDSESQR